MIDTHCSGCKGKCFVFIGLMFCGCIDFEETGRAVAEISGAAGATVNCFLPMADTTITADDPTGNYGAAPDCQVDALNPEKSCLLKWDLSSIPTTHTVTSVFAQVFVTDADVNPRHVKELLQPWVESEATWERRKVGTNWGAPGAKAATDRGSASPFTFSTSSGVQDLTVTPTGLARVQSWVNTPSTNNGVIIWSDDTHRVAIATKESSNPARMCVSHN